MYMLRSRARATVYALVGMIKKIVISRSLLHLFGVVRSFRRGVVDLNSTTLLLVRIMERQAPATLVLGSAEPEAQEMAARRGRRVVLVGSASVQNMLIGKELDVANLKDHVQRQTQASIFENLDGFLLGIRKRRNDAFVREAGERTDVVRVPPARSIVSQWTSTRPFVVGRRTWSTLWGYRQSPDRKC